MEEGMKKYKMMNPLEMHEFNHCHTTTQDMKQYTNCKMVQDCSKGYQNAAWSTHKLFCKLACDEAPSQAASKRRT
jgi:hypothetical protein